MTDVQAIEMLRIAAIEAVAAIEQMLTEVYVRGTSDRGFSAMLRCAEALEKTEDAMMRVADDMSPEPDEAA
jgi:MoxR-like ATPase